MHSAELDLVMDYLQFLERVATREVVSTVILVLVLLAGRYVVERYVRRRTRSDARSQRRWVSTVRNVTVSLLLLGLVFIWSPQLSSFALSLTAVALALVIATKEIILNLSGAVMKMVTSPFEVGDWIEVDGVRGEVISESLFAVKLEELDEGAGLSRFTGRTLTVPNSKFLTSTVIDEGDFRQFVFHRFRVHIDPAQNIFDKRDEIRSLAERHTQVFRAQGEQILAAARRKSHGDLPEADALVRIQTSELGKTTVEITVFCPTEQAVDIEQAIALETIALVESEAGGSEVTRAAE